MYKTKIITKGKKNHAAANGERDHIAYGPSYNNNVQLCCCACNNDRT